MNTRIGLLIGALCASTYATTEADPLAFSTFDQVNIDPAHPDNLEGWTVVDLDFPAIVGSPPNELATYTPEFSPTGVGGGSPSGTATANHIWFDDQTRDVFYWKAPNIFLGGNLVPFMGAFITFDLKAEGGSFVFNQEDIVIVGPTDTLVYDCRIVPDGTWRTYTVGMYDAGWRVGTLNGPEATRLQMEGAFSATQALYIRGEFRGTMEDIGRLDNVGMGVVDAFGAFSPDSPEPSTLMLLILAAAGFNTRRVLVAVGHRA